MSYFYDDDDYYNHNNKVNYYILTVLKFFGAIAAIAFISMLLILFGYMTFKVVTGGSICPNNNQIANYQAKHINY